MFGIQFKLKRDTRNLLLPYLDMTNPLTKIYPTIGYCNIIYNTILETLFYINLCVQF